MAIRYKTTTLNGKPIGSHRKVWILANGPIPPGMHVHHTNEDKFDNRIENLELIPASEHCRQHTLGREAWNKGDEYGKTEAYKKSNISRKANYNERCLKTLQLYNDSGLNQSELAKELGISRRSVCEHLKVAREIVVSP